MRNKKGFTLIELLVVIAIIGLLSTLAVVSLNNARGKARDARRVSDVKAIQTAFELYKNDNNDTLEGIAGVLNWAAIGTELTNYLPAGLPTDPANSADWFYTICVDASMGNFVVGATLENNPPAPGLTTEAWTGADVLYCKNSFGDADAEPVCDGLTGFCSGSAAPVAA